MFTVEDKAFIRTILADPAELTSWVVYADWLDEHDNPLHAEFLRLEVRRGELRDTDPEWRGVEERLRELRAALNPNWVAFFDRPAIESCDAAFQFQCPKQWENLKLTPDFAVRHCDACEKKVYFCRTLPEAQGHVRQGHCVAVQLDVFRFPGDLQPPAPRAEADDPIMVMGLMRLPAPPPPPQRRPWWKFW